MTQICWSLFFLFSPTWLGFLWGTELIHIRQQMQKFLHFWLELRCIYADRRNAVALLHSAGSDGTAVVPLWFMLHFIVWCVIRFSSNGFLNRDWTIHFQTHPPSSLTELLPNRQIPLQSVKPLLVYKNESERAIRTKIQTWTLSQEPVLKLL